MADVTIDQLTPKTSPVDGDQLEIDDGAGGSFKTTKAQLLTTIQGEVDANTAKVSADGSVATHSDVTSAGSGAIITTAERNKLNGIDAGAENNTSSNDGAGAGLAKAKSGSDLPFKSLVEGTNITLTEGADTVTITSTASGGGGGDVVGPASAVNNNLAAFDGTTGKLIKDSGSAVSAFATSTQGGLADSATQPGDNVSTLNNDAGYTDNAGDVVGPASSVTNRLATFNGITGKLIQDSGSVVSDFATSAQGALAATATQPGDNVSTLTNDAGYKAYFSGAVLPDPAGYAEGDLFMVTA